MSYKDYRNKEEMQWQEALQRSYKKEPKDGGLEQRIEQQRRGD